MESSSSRLAREFCREAQPARRLEHATEVLRQLGLKPGDAFNMLLAQIELRQALPFEVTTRTSPLLSTEEQADQWTDAFGAY